MFSLNKKTGYRQSWCKVCMREYAKLKNKERNVKKKPDPKDVFADILSRKRLTPPTDSV